MNGSASSEGRYWLSLTSSAFIAIVVGFASTILVIMQAAQTLQATPAQQASWAAALCFGMALTSLFLSWRHHVPTITAWSTPGAALIVTSGSNMAFSDTLGAFAVAGLLMAGTALIKPLARAIAMIPTPIAAAMLAGVLLHYSLGVPKAAVEMPYLVIPLIILFFIMRFSIPLYAVPVMIVAGVAMAWFSGRLDAACCELTLTRPVWTTPTWNIGTIISLGVPLFLVTMASQNLPGFAVIRAAGYEPPIKDSLLLTGLASTILAPFGSHAINMAALTATLVTGPDTHPDPAQRWRVAIPYCIMYLGVGMVAALCIHVLGALPKALITTIAGLALLTPLIGGLGGMVKDPPHIESAVVTFLVTASGVTFMGVGAAFWGLAAGLLIYVVQRIKDKTT